MKKTVLVALMFAVARVASAADPDPKVVPVGTDIGQRVPQFTAPVVTVGGEKVQTAEFDSHKATRITAYVFVGTTCPATNAYAERFKQLEEHYSSKGVDFLYIYPNSNDTGDAKLAFHKDKKLAGRLIDDQGARLARLFKAQRTTELFVADKHGIVVFHGGVDDSREPGAVKQRYLEAALDEVLGGKPVTVATSQVFA